MPSKSNTHNVRKIVIKSYKGNNLFNGSDAYLGVGTITCEQYQWQFQGTATDLARLLNVIQVARIEISLLMGLAETKFVREA